MKLTHILCAAVLAISTPLVLAHAEHGKPQYGGIYGEAGTFQLELVNQDKQVVLYVTVHGEPLSTKGATGKLTILGGDGKRDVELQPSGSHQLVAKLPGKLSKGSKVVATVKLTNQNPATVRFVIE